MFKIREAFRCLSILIKHLYVYLCLLFGLATQGRYEEDDEVDNEEDDEHPGAGFDLVVMIDPTLQKFKD